MILADTSVWINHFRGKEPGLALLLTEEMVVTHSFVIGELSLGHLNQRNQVLHDLRLLPKIQQATDEEVSAWIEKRRLYGKGFGWVDAHLLLSCLLTDTEFWTDDKTLSAAARAKGVKNRSIHH
jgi:predicted nucleic acid-binding protein